MAITNLFVPLHSLRFVTISIRGLTFTSGRKGFGLIEREFRSSGWSGKNNLAQFILSHGHS